MKLVTAILIVAAVFAGTAVGSSNNKPVTQAQLAVMQAKVTALTGRVAALEQNAADPQPAFEIATCLQAKWNGLLAWPTNLYAWNGAVYGQYQSNPADAQLADAYILTVPKTLWTRC